MPPTGKHPITIEQNLNRIIVRCGGQVIADSKNAVTVREANYRPVVYIPRRDVELSVLTASALVTHCPYKGDAEHYDLTAQGKIVQDAAWSYRNPCSKLSAIADFIAFYSERVDAIEEWEQ